MDDGSSFRVHYNLTTEYLRDFLESRLAQIKNTRKAIERRISCSALREPSAQMRRMASSLLRSVTNPKELREELSLARTEWDLVNIITAHARQQPVDTRLALEQSAGRFFTN